MRTRTIKSVLLFLGLLAAAGEVAAKTIYVAPSGNDAWSGQLAAPKADGTDGPVATLDRARDLIRQWKVAGPLTEPVQVILADGLYPIDQHAGQNSKTRPSPPGS